jgi:glycosyltransferase involved in cell wall biosynthesis
MGTWSRAVDLYFTPSSFARSKYVEAGWPAERIMVKPNFVADSGPGSGAGHFAAFVGRLSEEKGLGTLLTAWSKLGGLIPLKVVGDGPLAGDVQAAARANPAVEWLGRKPLPDVLNLLGDATFLVMPSEVYETLGRSILEAYSRGTPVIASRLGAMAEIVEHGRTGRQFTAGDPADLAEQVRLLLADAGGLARMREDARREYQEKYTEDRNYRMLLEIYRTAQQRRSSPRRRRALPVTS